MQGFSFKVGLLLPLLLAFAICMCQSRIEAKHKRQMLHHHHHHPRHPEHCEPVMLPPPPAQGPMEPPSQPPSLPPTEVEPSAPAPAFRDPVVVLPPIYQLTPFHVHACNSPCMGPKDCYWPCMACCANSTCCDQ